MLFSSIPFLYYFLPAVLILYFLVPRKMRNGVLLLGSLLFYAWGEPWFVLVMMLSIAVFKVILPISPDKTCTLSRNLSSVFFACRFAAISLFFASVGLVSMMRFMHCESTSAPIIWLMPWAM